MRVCFVLSRVFVFVCVPTSVCVEMVSEQGDGPEGSSTQVTFVRSLIRVTLHVSVQVGAARTRVAAQLALKRLLHP